MQPTTNRFPPLAVSDLERITATLETGEVQLWLADLDIGTELANRIAGTLSDDELGRAYRFRLQQHQRRFIVGRGLLRGLLELYTGLDRRRINFIYGRHGKPGVDSNWPCFNLAHSADHILVGFSSRMPLGVDIEQLCFMEDFEGIARRFYAPREWHMLSLQVGQKRLDAFFNCWTCKEAYTKAVGLGLTLPFKEFTVMPVAADRSRIEGGVDNDAVETRWSLHHLRPAPGLIGALATKGLVSLRTHRLNISEILA